MISLIFANVGTGKTTLLAKLALEYGMSDKYDLVLSNVALYGAKKFDVSDLGYKHIRKAAIFIDEGAIELPNTTKLDEKLKMFLRLHRHYECDIWIVSQSYEDVNIVVRRLYSSIWIMNRVPMIGEMSYYRCIHKSIGIDDESHQIVEKYKFKFPWPFINIRFMYRPLYYKYFDSYDAPQLKPSEFEDWVAEKPKGNMRQMLDMIRRAPQ